MQELGGRDIRLGAFCSSNGNDDELLSVPIELGRKRRGLNYEVSTINICVSHVLTFTVVLNKPLWDLRIDSVPWFRHLVKLAHVHLCLRRQLMRFGPPSDCLVIPTLVLGVEVYKRDRLRFALRLIPHLTEYANVGSAHQLLTKDVHAVRYMVPDDVFAVDECAFLLLAVVFIIPPKCLSKEVLRLVNRLVFNAKTLSANQAVQMVQSFHIRGVSAAV